MIRFIDIQTGNTYCGVSPFVHYFDGQQSTNLYYVKQICFASRCQSCKVTIPENNVFKLANLTSTTNESRQINANKENINGFDYVDKNSKFLRNKTEEVSLLTSELKLQGYNSKYGYLYMLYIIGSSDSAGEFHENITIVESNKESYNIEIAADFTAGDEALINGIHNYGAEIPERIQQAIYESDLREDATDNILINRKWKELLINFIDILNNKGNYKSLENSLNWFEYGDKIKLAEYWHKDEAGYEKLLRRELTKIADEEIIDMISYLWKTTYISIMMPLNKWVKSDWEWTEYETKEPKDTPIYDKDGNVISYMHPAYLDRKINNAKETYDREVMIGGGRMDFGIEDWPIPGSAPSVSFDTYNGANIWRDEDINRHAIIAEPIPELYKISFMWTRDMLMLKMALVNLYFEKYFLPIHIDSLFGSVEELIYTNTIKITYDKYIQIDTKVESNATIYSNVKSGNTYYMKDCDVCVTNSTPFGEVLLKYDTDESDEQYQAILGIDYSKDIELKEIDANSYYYNGPGCVIPFSCALSLPDDDLKVYLGEISISYKKDGKIIRTKRAIWNINNDSTSVSYDGNTCHIGFKIILFEPGDIQVSLKFDTNSYHTFIKEYDLHISDTTNIYIDLYKVKRISYDSMLAQLNREAMDRDGEDYKQAFSLLECAEMPERSEMNKFMWTSTPTMHYDYYAIIDTNHDTSARETLSNSWINVTDNRPHIIDICTPPAQIYKMFNNYKTFTDEYQEYFKSISLAELYNKYSYKYNIAGDIYYDPLNSISVNFTIKINPNGNEINYENSTVPICVMCNIDDNESKTFNFDITLKKTPNTSSTSICNVIANDEDAVKADLEAIGLNHCIYIDLKTKSDYRIGLSDDDYVEISDSMSDDELISVLDKFNWYWWGVEYMNESRYVIGIRKFYNANRESQIISADKVNIARISSTLDIKWQWDFNSKENNIIRYDIETNNIDVSNITLFINGVKQDIREDHSVDITELISMFATVDILSFNYEYDFIDAKGVEHHKAKNDSIIYIDKNIRYGFDDMIVKELENTKTTINENRFIPLLHKIEKLENTDITINDFTCIIPTIDYSTHDATLSQWCFVNKLTGESIYPSNEIGEHIHSIRAPFFTDNTRVRLSRGVYDIVLTYSLFGDDIVKTFKNAVIVK